jgi:integrase
MTTLTSRRPRGPIENWRPHASTRELVADVLAILDQFRDYWPLSVRTVGRDLRLQRRAARPAPGRSACRSSYFTSACSAEGVPPFSPHDLRHRRISLLHLRGVPWARIGEFVGQRSLSVTADTYTHVLTDEREVRYEALLR